MQWMSAGDGGSIAPSNAHENFCPRIPICGVSAKDCVSAAGSRREAYLSATSGETAATMGRLCVQGRRALGNF